MKCLFERWCKQRQLRPRLYGEKLSRVEESPAYPSYPGRANFSYISLLQKLASRLHEKQKVGSARRVTRLAGSPFCDGRVTLLAGPTFLHINTLARLAGSAPSTRYNQSMRELCCQLLAQHSRPQSHDPSDQRQGSKALAGPYFLSMCRVFVSYSQPIRFARFDGKSVNRGLPVLEKARAVDPCRRSEWS